MILILFNYGKSAFFCILYFQIKRVKLLLEMLQAVTLYDTDTFEWDDWKCKLVQWELSKANLWQQKVPSVSMSPGARKRAIGEACKSFVLRDSHDLNKKEILGLKEKPT